MKDSEQAYLFLKLSCEKYLKHHNGLNNYEEYIIFKVPLELNTFNQ